MTAILLLNTKFGRQLEKEILDYKEAVDSIYCNENVSFCFNTDQCECADSSFCNLHHKYLSTRQLRIIKNYKLRKHIKKGPKCREPRTINVLIQITAALDTCIDLMTLKTNYVTSNVKPWKETAFSKVKKK